MYYRGVGEDFSDEQRLEAAVALGQNDQELVFDINGPTVTIEAIRINLIPSNVSNRRIAYIKLYSLAAAIRYNQTGENDSTLIFLHSAGQIQQHGDVFGMTLNSKVLGELFCVDRPDPSITISFAPVLTLSSSDSLVVRVSLEYLFSDEYLLARDHFIVSQERLEQKVHSLEAEIAQLQQGKNQFDAYQQSPLWQGFVALNRVCESIRIAGVWKACAKPFQPSWWSKRSLTDYEKWRAANGYENRKEP